ncbi:MULTISPECIES: NAD(P)-dependent malic enzyme [Niallia]|uniref:NAD-dependent malic enzyme n=1 Tax=Niallia circulans TaxID=1397 RepID=A0A268FCN7_NIACI|nr:malic enzyme-like NAD(P)-binding protein [Niallia circulans]AYV67817.1 NAD-dependent malic enzyme [Niallia circulans]AYV73833.1 NAD-dependent malic enzyme [Niallia circulans]PAD83140.1 NAD-dependent malic enzyme [Niallia circulans]UQZ76139.1 NAD-dependent malic enzyme [Niallia circulans]
MSLREDALHMHQVKQGKLEIHAKVEVKNAQDLSLAYSPGVAEPCKEIFENPETVYDFTMKGNMVGLITNGTSVLGLGNIGAEASLPVMEGKAILLKSFAGVDAFPIVLNSTDVDKIVDAVKLMAPTFGAIHLEDIAAPQCFEIEERLNQELAIPVYHDDQHGTAIVALAGLLNALKIVKKEMKDLKIVINGAGASGIAITKLFNSYGVTNMIICDTKGAIFAGRTAGMNPAKESVAAYTNVKLTRGTLRDVLVGADVFIGVSVANTLTKEMVQTMNKDAIIFALANPVPEISPAQAKEAGAVIVGTGRSDFPNQVNNVLAFPGIFRGALDVRATTINEEMKKAAAEAIAGLVADAELNEDYVIPSPFDPRVAPAVASAVAKAAMETKVARIQVNPEAVRLKTMKMTTFDKE